MIKAPLPTCQSDQNTIDVEAGLRRAAVDLRQVAKASPPDKTAPLLELACRLEELAAQRAAEAETAIIPRLIKRWAHAMCQAHAALQAVNPMTALVAPEVILVWIEYGTRLAQCRTETLCCWPAIRSPADVVQIQGEHLRAEVELFVDYVTRVGACTAALFLKAGDRANELVDATMLVLVELDELGRVAGQSDRRLMRIGLN